MRNRIPGMGRAPIMGRIIVCLLGLSRFLNNLDF